MPPTLQPVLNLVPGDELSSIVDLSWTPSNKTGSAGFGYSVEYSDDDGATWEVYSDTTDTDEHVDLTGSGVDTYSFRVVPYNDAGEGPSSESVAIILPVTMQTPNLSVEVDYLSYEAYLTWNLIPGASYYRYSWRYNGGGWNEESIGPDNTYMFSGSSGDGLYEFRVQGANDNGEGPWSDPAGVTLPGESEGGMDVTYRRPDAVSRYLRPDGTSSYLRFAA
ncbi:Fibronectin type III domain-containing protein [Prosthecobacter debontii]|uniref:Fibronectin type III domain-containing protein n=1 Tax=Prosthecobacter debontii TaxID=48467 RepID=A0A1T4X5T1_9BACT|nr:fibronectin type III domain-containing protein [Prosthecobacter debontii]SKA84942.1 Fibronectin type III domain-containing protein [Prosthecobacter debontii]